LSIFDNELIYNNRTVSKISENDSFDAIVVGTGISGGWAAKELCEKGFKTLVLERGRMVKHVKDYPTMHDDPWDYKFKGQVPREEAKSRKTGQNRLYGQ